MAKARKRSLSRMISRPSARPIRMLLVADSGTARILRLSGRSGSEKLTEVALLELPAAHLQKQDMVSDKTGRLFSRGRVGPGPRSTARSGAASDFDPHTVVYERFAKRIARRLDTERRNGDCQELVIIAAPHFLGMLRPQLSPSTRKIVVREVAKDLVRAKDAQLLRSASS
jgi:protein required for attachment to host cells